MHPSTIERAIRNVQRLQQAIAKIEVQLHAAARVVNKDVRAASLGHIAYLEAFANSVSGEKKTEQIVAHLSEIDDIMGNSSYLAKYEREERARLGIKLRSMDQETDPLKKVGIARNIASTIHAMGWHPEDLGLQNLEVEISG